MNGISGIEAAGAWPGQRVVEKGSDKTRQSSFLGSSRRELSEEEMKRLEELRDQLVMTLAKGDKMTAEDQRRIREIEAEIEELTGMGGSSRRFSITDAVEKLKKTDGTEDDGQEGVSGAERTGFSIQEQLKAKSLPASHGSSGPGIMSFLRRHASAAYAASAAPASGQAGPVFPAMVNGVWV